ncbi:hypothetical protein J5491_04035 [Candidatus Saccharibacteria bacterium]|nr:hypothetical protein [Candidatus Saccharibacteria bacterium]
MEEQPTTHKHSRLTILLSINAAVILIVGVMVSSAIRSDSDTNFRVVDERSDTVEETPEEITLFESTTSSESNASNDIYAVGNDDYVSTSSHEFDNTPVSPSELWNEKAITIYATPDIDICVGGGLKDLGEMYWQTSNSNVISGFYGSARTWLGYNNETCRYPVISGLGVTTITAGTYDGKRKDSIVVNVIAPPVQQWEREVLTIVNRIRIKNNLNQLSWGATCEGAALVRANEAMELYAHTRPDGSDWSTACPAPNDNGASGENLAIGNAAVSPATTVALWMSSETHRANILSPEYTNLAVGFVFDPNSTYRTYWSQFFSTY